MRARKRRSPHDRPLRDRARSGHHVFACRAGGRAGPRGGRGAESVPADIPPAGLGGARAERHPVLAAGRAGRAHGDPRPRSRRHRRHRHHEPARDNGGVEPRDGKARGQRHRVAVPPHRAAHRGYHARCGRGAHDRGQDGPCARRLLLGQQDQVDPRQRARRPRRRAGRAPRVRHGGQLARVDAHERRGARHRPHERQPHPALRHPPRPLGRRPA